MTNLWVSSAGVRWICLGCHSARGPQGDNPAAILHCIPKGGLAMAGRGGFRYLLKVKKFCNLAGNRGDCRNKTKNSDTFMQIKDSMGRK